MKISRREYMIISNAKSPEPLLMMRITL